VKYEKQKKVVFYETPCILYRQNIRSSCTNLTYDNRALDKNDSQSLITNSEYHHDEIFDFKINNSH